ncbi:MAG: hypothetical protein QME96_18275, partial [Myxococcota bacterium]|nr:hypothetical protein [Myxococcota bacterium]
MTTITLEPLIDQLPVLLVSGDGTVLDGNLAWTRFVASRRGAGARPGLYDLITFVGAPVSPTAGPREMRVHHIALRDADGDGRSIGPYSAALFVPVVHRRRDTYVVFLLPPRTFRPDAARFAGLLAADVEGRGSGVAGRRPESDLVLPIDVEGLVRNAADLVAATAAPDAGTPEDLPATILSRLRCGIPSRRLVLSVSADGGAAIPEGVFRLPPDGATPEDVRRGPAPLLRHAPADAGVEGGAAVRECSFEALPAWLQREFVDSPGAGGSRRYLVASVVIPGGAAVLAAGPWGAGESVSPDEPSLVEIAIRLLAARVAVAARERALEERARRLDAALEAERAA